jgi:hypothetical protein
LRKRKEERNAQKRRMKRYASSVKLRFFVVEKKMTIASSREMPTSCIGREWEDGEYCVEEEKEMVDDAPWRLS